MPTADSPDEHSMDMAASVDLAAAAAALRKPDKPFPCPRCQSIDTKFCYFNNYNVNQPRHFCRRCQRYWTAGGSLRNLPVGAGKRKHKRPQKSDAGMLAFDEALRSPQHTSQYIHKQRNSPKSNSKSPRGRDGVSHPTTSLDSFEDDAEADETCQSGGSSSTPHMLPIPSMATTSPIPSSTMTSESGNLPPGCPWPLPWPYGNAGMNMAGGWAPPVDQATAASAMWAGAAAAASFFQFHPMWRPMGWNPMPWNVIVNVNSAPSMPASPPSTPVGVTCLAQETEEHVETNQPQETSEIQQRDPQPPHSQAPLCIPKSLKIGDPDEVMHSSILTTLGLSSMPAAGFFNLNALPKAEGMQNKPSFPEETEIPKVHSNPAAQARSLAFQEHN